MPNFITVSKSWTEVQGKRSETDVLSVAEADMMVFIIQMLILTNLQFTVVKKFSTRITTVLNFEMIIRTLVRLFWV